MISKDWLRLVTRTDPFRPNSTLYRLRLVRTFEASLDNENKQHPLSETDLKRNLVEHLLHEAYGEARALLPELRRTCLLAARNYSEREQIESGFSQLQQLLHRIDCDPKDLVAVPAVEPIPA